MISNMVLLEDLRITIPLLIQPSLRYVIYIDNQVHFIQLFALGLWTQVCRFVRIQLWYSFDE
jgi:hypothetical protein